MPQRIPRGAREKLFGSKKVKKRTADADGCLPGRIQSRCAETDRDREVRKAHGVFYTPPYIVDYIVGETVGRLLEGKTPRRAARLRVLDPACGEGVFLIGAYQHLLDWHRDWYVADDPEKHARARSPRLYRGAAGDWRLTTGEKKRILLANVYGVDIDPQAVEVTKLSLLLKVLEGESKETVNNQLRFFHQRALPDLGGNIKCGNSLVGPDFYDHRQMNLLDEEERYRINVFDWIAEFPEALKSRGGGFDAVVGNPPYVLLQDAFRDDEQLQYFRSKFTVASYKLDTYHLFMERAVRLTRAGGRCAMITPANFLTNTHLHGLRRLLLEAATVERILVLEGGVFHGISVDNAVFVAVAGRESEGTFPVLYARPCQEGLLEERRDVVSVKAARNDEHVLFTGASSRAVAKLWTRLRQRCDDLGSLAHVNFGKQLRDRRRFPQDVIHVKSARAVVPPYKPCYTGRNVTRYRLQWERLACLDDEAARRGGCWDTDKQNARDKLITRQIGKFPEFAIDTKGYQCLNTVFMIKPRSPEVDPVFLLGVLNSRLLRAYWLDRFYDRRRTFPKIKGTYLKQLPICRVEVEQGDARIGHQRIIDLVRAILSLHGELETARTDHGKTAIQRQIQAADRQIDRLVYELYGLSEEEIALVEEVTSQ